MLDQPFEPTHRIQVRNSISGQVLVDELVMLVDFFCYSKDEWENLDDASWTYSDEDGLLFQGMTSPYNFSTVTFRQLVAE